MKVIVLFSGGIDSRLLVERAHRSGQLDAVYWVNYNQPNCVLERKAVDDWAKPRGVEVLWSHVPLLGDMRADYGAPGPRIVPHRNLVLLGCALNAASVRGADQVWLGATKDDDESYVDCRASYHMRLNALLHAPERLGRTDGVKYSGPVVDYPLEYMPKVAVVRELVELGVDLGETWSCYTPARGRACGTCDACVQRLAAIEAL